MKNTFIAALACATAAIVPVFAGESIDYGAIFAAPGTVTRAQVRLELQRARASGELYENEATYPHTAHEPATMLTRAEVRAEVRRARAAGELDLTEVNYPALASKHGSNTASGPATAHGGGAGATLVPGKAMLSEAGATATRR